MWFNTNKGVLSQIIAEGFITFVWMRDKSNLKQSGSIDTIHSPCMGFIFCPFNILCEFPVMLLLSGFFKPVQMKTIPPCGVTFSSHNLSQPLHKHRRAAALCPLPLSLPVDVLTTKDSSQVTLKVTSISILCSFRQMQNTTVQLLVCVGSIIKRQTRPFLLCETNSCIFVSACICLVSRLPSELAWMLMEAKIGKYAVVFIVFKDAQID